MSNTIYDILAKALPHLPADLAGEAQAAIAEYKDETFLNERLGLTKTEAAIYNCLAASPGVSVPYDAIMKAANIESIDTLWVHKRRLMVKIEKHGLTIGRKTSKAGGGYSLDTVEA